MALDCEGAGVGAVMLVSIFVLRQGVQVTTLSSSGRAAELEIFVQLLSHSETCRMIDRVRPATAESRLLCPIIQVRNGGQPAGIVPRSSGAWNSV